MAALPSTDAQQQTVSSQRETLDSDSVICGLRGLSAMGHGCLWQCSQMNILLTAVDFLFKFLIFLLFRITFTVWTVRCICDTRKQAGVKEMNKTISYLLGDDFCSPTTSYLSGLAFQPYTEHSSECVRTTTRQPKWLSRGPRTQHATLCTQRLPQASLHLELWVQNILNQGLKSSFQTHKKTKKRLA